MLAVLKPLALFLSANQSTMSNTTDFLGKWFELPGQILDHFLFGNQVTRSRWPLL